jgi:hypothetical protein
MLDQASVLTMFRNHQTTDRRLAELVAAVVGPDSVPAEVQVTVMPGESIHDIYFGRRITAGEAGIEVVGIDSFLETMSGHQDEEVGLFRVANEQGWLLGVFDQETRQLVACVGKFSAAESRTQVR